MHRVLIGAILILSWEVGAQSPQVDWPSQTPTLSIVRRSLKKLIFSFSHTLATSGDVWPIALSIFSHHIILSANTSWYWCWKKIRLQPYPKTPITTKGMSSDQVPYYQRSAFGIQIPTIPIPIVGIWDMGFGIWISIFGIRDWDLGYEFGFSRFAIGIWDMNLDFRDVGLGFRIWI